MKRMTKIGIYGMAVWMLSACGNGTPDYDATGTFEATEVIVSAEAAGKLLQLEVEEGTRLKAGEEVGLVDTVQLYLKKLQLEANMKSVESQRPRSGQTDSRYQTANYYSAKGKEAGREPACCRSCQSETTG